MAYTKSNEIQTRISLKYDSYSNWTSKNPVLLKGEVAIATIASNDTNKTETGFQNLPNVVMKVGDGTSRYNSLKFVSGLAADVYDWAKAPSKPSYDWSEISGALEYQIVVVDAATYKYELQARKAGSSDNWAKVSDLDLSDIDSRLDAVENKANTLDSDLNTASTGLKARMTTAEKEIDALQEAINGDNGAVGAAINAAIQALDGEASQEAGADGLALSVTTTDGIVTAISGSIKANTYDAHGAAAAVQGDTTKTVKEAYERADAAYALADAAQTSEEVAKAINDKIATLGADSVEGTQSGATIKFINKVSQANGILSAELGELKLNSAYVASGDDQNLIATMADVNSAVADLNGAMHFEGVSTTDPVNDKITIADKPNYVPSAGDVVIYVNANNTPVEYVYDGSKWNQLGNESIAQKAIENLDVADISVGADSTLTVIGETDGLVHATVTKIQIADTQVTGLPAALKALTDKDKELAEDVGANTTAIGKIIGSVAGDDNKSMRTVATEEATKAVQNLNKDNAAQSGKYISAINQANGIVTASYENLPVLAITHAPSITTPTENEVVVVGEITHNGYTITDTHVKVATAAGIANAIAALDADKDVSSAKHVMTGVTQENGVIKSIDEVKLADIAFSGNVADLQQTTNTYVVFNCGDSEKNI